MGLLSTILGYIPPEQPSKLNSIFPAAAAQKIRSGKLPTIQADKLILATNEVCHFVDVGTAVTEKVRRQSLHTGGSYRVFKGYTSHLGQTQSVATSEPHYTNGVFYITNQRVIFVAKSNGFDKKIKNLTAITPYSDGIGLQFGSKSYLVLLPDGVIAKQVMDLIV